MTLETKEFLGGLIFTAALFILIWILFAGIPEGFYR